MRKIMFAVFVIVASVFSLKAEGYEMFIKKGLTWKEFGTSTDASPQHPHFPQTVEMLSLEKEVEYDGKTVLELYSRCQGVCCDYYADEVNYEKRLIAYLYTDGGKVYYHPLWQEEPVWYLMYDFGLDLNEGCDVWTLLESKHDDMEHRSTYVWCKDVTKSSIDGRVWEVMEMGERLTYLGNVHESSRTGKWLRGLGDVRGLASPNGYDLVGGGSRMIEAKFNGELIYQDYPAGLNLASADGADFTVEVDGGRVTVRGTSGRAGIYSIDGHLVKTVMADEAVDLPGGLYIIKSGERSHKVIL